MNIQTPLDTRNDDAPLYERDFAAWLAVQAALLRAREGHALDWDALAEEIEDMGGNLLRELRSRLSVILVHVIKLRLSHADRPRAGWRKTIRTQRSEIASLLKQSPSLRRHLDYLPYDLFDDARAIAIDALEEHEPASISEYREAAQGLEVEEADNLLDRDWFPPIPEDG